MEFRFSIYCRLITSDGCLSNDGRHIDFTSKDVKLLETFKKCLNLNVKIGHKTSSFTGKKCTRIQFGDIIFYKWLESIGLTTNKSKTLNAINIPDELFFDFLRGEFDGDGTFYSYWDTRWQNSFMFYISFASGSKNFLTWLQQQLNILLKVKGSLKTSKRAWQLSFAKKESIKIINSMYYSEEIPCLNRKRTKIFKALEIAQEIKVQADVMKLVNMWA
jgi:hypothetical protein